MHVHLSISFPFHRYEGYVVQLLLFSARPIYLLQCAGWEIDIKKCLTTFLNYNMWSKSAVMPKLLLVITIQHLCVCVYPVNILVLCIVISLYRWGSRNSEFKKALVSQHMPHFFFLKERVLYRKRLKQILEHWTGRNRTFGVSEVRWWL